MIGFAKAFGWLLIAGGGLHLAYVLYHAISMQEAYGSVRAASKAVSEHVRVDIVTIFLGLVLNLLAVIAQGVTERD